LVSSGAAIESDHTKAEEQECRIDGIKLPKCVRNDGECVSLQNILEPFASKTISQVYTQGNLGCLLIPIPVEALRKQVMADTEARKRLWRILAKSFFHLMPAKLAMFKTATYTFKESDIRENCEVVILQREETICLANGAILL
jgi:hypothetical protein